MYEVDGFEKDDFCYSLQKSFDVILRNSSPFYTRFYQKLLERRPDFKNLFSNTNFDQQGEKLVSMIQYAIDRLAILQKIKTELINLGKRHVSYGVREEDYQDTGMVLLETLEESLGDEWTQNLKENWQLAITEVASLMIQGHKEI
nr:globin domain-containing protein [Leptospira brenneri]